MCVQVNNSPMVALVEPLYDCLFRLAQSDALANDEEVGAHLITLSH